ncbi:MAG: hypothetical protein SFU27_08830 [Thermonemataceae bacterium]|nr:hypothetical protein [Thermonemataceae bacterium]
MKKIGFISAFVVGMFAMAAFKPASKHTEVTMEVSKKPNGEICFSVKNDTGSSITLHTGSGTSPMPNGSTKNFCLKAGKELSIADKGRPGKTLLVAGEANNGQKYSLSELIKKAN